MNWLCKQSVDLLRETYSEGEALFPFSTRLAGGRLRSDYSPPETRRYTINTLLGLRAAARAQPTEPWLGRLGELVEAFLDRHYAALRSPADNGLLLVLLSEMDGAHALLPDVLARVERFLAEPGFRALHMQDLAWMLWGAVAAARCGLAGAEAAAAAVFELIDTRFVHPGSLLPRHTLDRYRRNLVSFGSLVYFLRAMREYASLTGDARAGQFFSSGVERALAFQGPGGEWPWMIDVRSGRPVDWYPVFAVHQDSMAILFLGPAAAAGVPGAERAIERSVAWTAGENELRERFYRTDPFLLYRSIERTETLPRLRRYARYVSHSARPEGAAPFPTANVRISPDCRSYHAGWILVVWAGAETIPGLDEPRAVTAPAGHGS